MKNTPYGLEQASQKLNVTKDDLLLMAERGELVLSFYWDGLYALPESCVSESVENDPGFNDYINLKPIHATILHNKGTLEPGAINMHGGCTTQDGEEIVPYYRKIDSKGLKIPGAYCAEIETPEITLSHIRIFDNELSKIKAVGARNKQDADNIWRTGDIALCDAFGVGRKSMSAVRRSVKNAGKEFDYDPITGEKRLTLADINECLAMKNK